MGSKTEIDWTDSTWNPVTGCTAISEGCSRCYARAMSTRFGKGFDVVCHADRLDIPRRWRNGRRVFVCSMGDLFHADVPGAFIDQVFDVMRACPKHTFQVLTKRADRLKDYGHALGVNWPINVWAGVTVENQNQVYRIDAFSTITAETKCFVSFEPLLERISLRGTIALAAVDWVIVGGETGPGARPMCAEWVREIRDWCRWHRVPFFFKQWGSGSDTPWNCGAGFTRGEKNGGFRLDGEVWRQFPKGVGI